MCMLSAHAPFAPIPGVRNLFWLLAMASRKVLMAKTRSDTLKARLSTLFAYSISLVWCKPVSFQLYLNMFCRSVQAFYDEFLTEEFIKNRRADIRKKQGRNAALLADFPNEAIVEFIILLTCDLKDWPWQLTSPSVSSSLLPGILLGRRHFKQCLGV